MSQDQNKFPQFVNITVTVQPNITGDGNSRGGHFDIICTPPSIPVMEGDAVINFQLIEPTPPSIRFTGFDQAGPYRQRKLSPPCISVDGRMMTFNDCNARKEPICLALKFRQCHEIESVPEMPNKPEPADVA